MKWHIQSKAIPNNLEELESILLDNRGIKDKEAFFTGVSPFKISLKELGIDPKQLKKIKTRLNTAKSKAEQIIIFGDYDADGISASAVLWQVMTAEGYQVLPFIPNRLKHGYGLSIKALKDLLNAHENVNLIITVDNGIVAHEALNFLKKRKIDVIVTDHHQMDEQPLTALAVFHSTQVCGCAVAWFLARELSTGKEQHLLEDLLALVAIATVTDLMPLLAVNRSLLIAGLKVLKQNTNVGLKQLFLRAKLNATEVNAYTLGFQIGPRINAMGRLADGMDALRLLCTKDQNKAVTLSNLLNQTNEDRQNLTLDLTKEADQSLLKVDEEAIIILSSAQYHEGIIGLMAGRMVEKFSKPSIVISIGPKTAKASARSLADFNITEFIRLFRQDLLELGGHPMAAGFALESNKVEKVVQAMRKKAKELLKGRNLEKTLELESVLPATMATFSTMKLINRFAPFGLANPRPIFLLKKTVFKNYRLIGKESQHLKLVITVGTSNQEFEVLAWNKAELIQDIKIGANLDLAISLDLNSYRGINKLQFILHDLKES